MWKEKEWEESAQSSGRNGEECRVKGEERREKNKLFDIIQHEEEVERKEIESKETSDWLTSTSLLFTRRWTVENKIKLKKTSSFFLLHTQHTSRSHDLERKFKTRV